MKISSIPCYVFSWIPSLKNDKLEQIQGSTTESITAVHVRDQGSIPCLGEFFFN